MSASGSKGGVLRSMVWAGAESGLGMAISIGSLLGIARLIGVQEFGLGTLAYGFVVLVTIAAMTMMHDVVVQRAELTDRHRIAAVKGSVIIGLVLGGLCVALAPLAAWIYEQPRLGWLMVGLAPTVLLESAGTPFLAMRRRSLDFKGAARCLLSGKLVGLIVGVLAAVMGAGAWSIVLQQLTTSTVSASCLMLAAGPLPRGRFSWSAFHELIRFTGKIVLTQVIQHGSERIFLAYVGYMLGVSAAGYWSLAIRLVENITGSVGAALYQVTLAHFSPLQHDIPALRARLAHWLAWLGLGSLCFVAAGLIVSGPGLAIILGDAWRPAAPAVAVMLVTTLLFLRRVVPSGALTSTGHPGAALRVQTIENLIIIPVLLLSHAPSVVAVALIRLMRGVIGNVLVQFELRRYLGVSFGQDLIAQAGQLVIGTAAVALGVLVDAELHGLGVERLTSAISGGVLAAIICIALTLAVRPSLWRDVADLWQRRRAIEPSPAAPISVEATASPRAAAKRPERVLPLALAGLLLWSWAARAAPPALPDPIACPTSAERSGAVMHVAVDGDDRWSGTIPRPSTEASDGPKRTLQAAITALADGTPATVLMGDGEYFLPAEVVLDERRAGLAIMAAPGARPVLHGGINLSGAPWREGPDGTLLLTLDRSDQASDILDLHVDGARQIEARWPNLDPAEPLRSGWLVAAAGIAGHEAIKVRDADWPAVLRLGPAQLHVVDVRQWTSNNARIEELAPARRLLRLADNPPWHELGPGSRYYLYGSPAMIDRPQEWAWDAGSRTLSYRPPIGWSRTATHRMVGATTDTLLRISGSHDILIAGLELRDGSPHGGDRGPPWYQRGGGAIRVERSSNVLICGNRIEGVGVGIRMTGVEQATIAGNRIRRTASNAIFIDMAGKDRPSRNVLVLDNEISEVGRTFIESGGVIAYGTSDGVIARNRIADSSQMGIMVGQIERDGSDVSRRMLIARNRISDANQASADGGGIKLFAAVQREPFDTLLEENWIDRMGQSMSRPDGSFFGPEEREPGRWPQPVSAGIYFDWRVSGAVARGNLVTGGWTGILLTNAADNRFSGNVVWGGVGAAVALANWTEQDKADAAGWRMSGNLFEHNLFVRTHPLSNAVEIRDPQPNGPAATFLDNSYGGPAAAGASFTALPAGRNGLRGQRNSIEGWSSSRWSGGGERLMPLVAAVDGSSRPPLDAIVAMARSRGIGLASGLLDMVRPTWHLD